MLAVWVWAGCAVTVRGMVGPEDDQTVLETVEGQVWRLRLEGDAEQMRWLDGHVAEVEGRAVGRRLRVQDWRVLEGLHGMPTWVGTLERRQGRMGLFDRNSGAFYFVDEVAEATLAPYLGLPVLLEGFVDGAHRVRVLYFRPLAPDPEEPS